ncbi:MAG: hypothetical protein FWF27_00960 [Candidatus Bathyarchaeota archaeon]|nr:hypothetical protein [Candidatus Termiticorpusculum sp.]
MDCNCKDNVRESNIFVYQNDFEHDDEIDNSYHLLRMKCGSGKSKGILRQIQAFLITDKSQDFLLEVFTDCKENQGINKSKIYEMNIRPDDFCYSSPFVPFCFSIKDNCGQCHNLYYRLNGRYGTKIQGYIRISGVE